MAAKKKFAISRPIVRSTNGATAQKRRAPRRRFTDEERRCMRRINNNAGDLYTAMHGSLGMLGLAHPRTIERITKILDDSKAMLDVMGLGL